jgi:putative copper export protein
MSVTRLVSLAVTAVLVTVHLLAAAVWVGGSTALVFVGVPAIRTLEGEPRGRAMKELGLRWRPLGYGALLVAALTGITLAAREWQHSTAFEVVFWVKVVLFVGLVIASYLHNFVYGPRLQAEIREGREPKTRPTLVVVGWISYGLTVTLPILGVALDRIVN